MTYAEHSYVEKYLVCCAIRIEQEEAERKTRAEKEKLEARKLKQHRRKELLLAMNEEDRKLFGYGLNGVKISNKELD